jgi:pyruvate/2-oxoglutarate/acetoin dehydrogenase E1 component
VDQKIKTTYLETLRSGLEDLIRDDPKVYLLGEDICDPYGGAFKVTKGLSSKYPDRLINTPMSEQGFTGVGVGMALAGLKPIIEIMFGDFVGLTMDQILNHASKFVEGFQKKVQLVVRTPMGGYRGYGATHSQSIEKLYFGLPNIFVISPSVVHDPGELLKKSIEIGSPVLFVENKLDYTHKLFRNEKNADLFDIKYHGGDFPICEVNLKSETPQLTIISYGGMVSPVLKMIFDMYIAEEIPVRLLAPSSVSPLNFELLAKLTYSDSKIMTIEEGHVPFGFGDAVISNLHQNGIHAQFKTIGAKNNIIGASKNVEDKVLPNFEVIIKEILQFIN